MSSKKKEGNTKEKGRNISLILSQIKSQTLQNKQKPRLLPIREDRSQLPEAHIVVVVVVRGGYHQATSQEGGVPHGQRPQVQSGKEEILRQAPFPDSLIQNTRGLPYSPFRASSTGKTGGGKATTTTSPKGDKSSKSKDHHHAWKQPSLYARAVGTLKKSVGKSHKTETGTTSSKKASKHDDQDSPKGEAEEHKANHDSSEEKEHEDHGEIDEVEHDHKPDHSKPDAAGDDDDDKVESPTIIEERDANIDKAESPTVCEDSDDSDSKVDSPTLLGQIDDPDADPAKAESPVKSETGESQHIVSVDSPTVSEEHDHASLGEITFTEEMKEHIENAIDNTTHPNEEAEAEAEAEAEEEAKSEVEDEEGSATKQAQGKKDVGLSNNVIEEMTREQRLNKVKALAGAFETVIQVHKK